MKKIIVFFCLLIAFSGCNIGGNININVTDENIIEVSIRNSEFEPNNILIEKGIIVKWTNYDSQGHTVTIDGLFDSKTITKGKSFSYTFNEIGEFEYYCKIHPDMKGTIVVQ